MTTTKSTFFLIVTSLLSWTNGLKVNRCSTQASDLYFVIDSSHSIGVKDFQRQLLFIRALVDRFTLGENQFRVGVLSFSTDIKLDIRLDDFTSVRNLTYKILNIPQMGLGTETHKALRFIHKKGFSAKYGSRPWAKRQVILITDGLSQNAGETSRQASIAKSKGIEIFSIGVGGWELVPHLKTIASAPAETHTYRVDNYKSLGSLRAALTSATCEEMQGDQPGQDEGEMAHSVCSVNAADVVFVLDASSSIWEPYFDLQKEFVNQVISNFEIGPLGMRVGVVLYSNTPLTLYSLSDHQKLEHIQKIVKEAPHVRGNTDTAFAIQYVRERMFQPHHSRPNTAKVMILLTDGKSNNMSETIREAEKARKDGINIFTIGIGPDAKSKTLISMASLPSDQYFLHAKDVSALAGVKDLLSIRVCDAASTILKTHLEMSCPSSPRDTVFVYDTNVLSPRHRKYAIGAIADVTSAKVLKGDSLRFGVLREASDTSSVHDIELTKEWTRSEFIHELENDSQKFASIHLLLRKARTKYFSPAFQFDHIERKKTVVIFLDSPLQRAFLSDIEAFRLKNSYVNIVVVTFGDHFMPQQAKGLVSKPQDMYTINTPHRLHQRHKRLLANRLLTVICA